MTIAFTLCKCYTFSSSISLLSVAARTCLTRVARSLSCALDLAAARRLIARRRLMYAINVESSCLLIVTVQLTYRSWYWQLLLLLE